MAILDSMNQFSWQQACFASSADVVSTNLIDLAPQLVANAAATPDEFRGEDFEIEVVLTSAVTGGTSVAFILQTDTNTNFATALQEFPMSAAIPVASLVAGYKLSFSIPNSGCKRYLRVVYRNVGANTTGAADAYVAKDVQNNFPQAGSGYFVG